MTSSKEEMYKKIAERGTYYTYFFNKLDKVSAFDELAEKGFFKEASEARREGGYISFPEWAPANYFIRVAKKIPEKVMDTILSVSETDNQTVHAQFVKAASEMPGEQSVRIVPSLIKWLKNSNIHTIPHFTIELISHLLEVEKRDEALILAKEMTVVGAPDKKTNEYLRHAVTRIPVHELDMFFKNEFTGLVKATPIEATKLLINGLFHSLRHKENATKEVAGIIEDYSEIWLPEFANELNRSNPETIFATNIYRIIQNTHDLEVKDQIIDLLLAEKYRLFKRLAAVAIGEGNTNPEYRKVYDEIISKFGSLTHHLPMTSWTGPESPLKEAQIQKMTLSELIEYLNTWEPTERIMAPSKEGLGRQLSEQVSKNPDLGINLLKRINDIPEEYLNDIFNALGQSLGNNTKVNIQELVPSLEVLLDKFESDTEVVSRNTLLSILRMIESAADSEELDLSIKESKGIYFRLIELGLISSKASDEDNEDPFDEKGMDADIGSFNTLKGVALHTLMSIMKRATRQYQEDNDDPLFAFTQADRERIVAILNKHVSLNSQTSYAVRAVYAHAYPYLWTVMHNWTISNINNIFPEDNRLYFQTNMESYFKFSHLDFSSFQDMKPKIVVFMKLLGQNQLKPLHSNTINHMTSKIINAYISSVIEFDDPVLVSYFKLQNEYVSEAIDFIGRGLDNLAGQKKALRRAMAYWEARKPTATKEEMSYFASWFVNGSLGYKWREANYLEILRKIDDQESMWQVFDWFKDNVGKSPESVSKILETVIRTQSNDTLRYIIFKDIDSVLQVLAESKDPVIRIRITNTIEKMLTKGLGDYRALLT